MTREEQLQFCKFCVNQKFSLKQGVICRITNHAADFEESCNLYVEDVELKNRLHKTYLTDKGHASTTTLRFLNFTLDSIFVTLFGFVLMMIGAKVVPQMLVSYLSQPEYVRALIWLVLLFGYYFLMESLTGRTLAKYITKTKVVTLKDEKPEAGTIFFRTICRFIPFDALSYFGDGEDTGWHDKISKTKVVSA
jgi:uncharacterized RDD family membrane protein YckC